VTVNHSELQIERVLTLKDCVDSASVMQGTDHNSLSDGVEYVEAYHQ